MISYIVANWKTTLIGVAFAIMLGVHDAYVNGTLHKSTIAMVILAALWAFVSKDVNVTGGSVPNAGSPRFGTGTIPPSVRG